MKFEDILHEIGDEHRFQTFLIILLLLPTSLFNSYFEGMFLLSTPDHWCRVPEIEHLPLDQQERLIRPLNPITGKKSNCEHYDRNFSALLILMESSSSIEYLDIINESISDQLSTVQCQNGWYYDKSLYTETASTWFNFVCDRSYYVNLIMSLSAIGLATMTPLISNLSDRIGRRKAFILTCFVAVLSCTSPLLFKNIHSFLITRYLAGGVINVFFQLPFVLTQELVSQRYRTRASCLSAIFYSLGACSVTLALKLTRNWVTFTYLEFIVAFVFILGMKWIPESPCWLISKKRYQEAYDQLSSIAKVNGKKVPDDLMERIMSLEDSSNNNNGKKDLKEEKDSFFDLFLKSGLRSKTFNVTMVFVACSIGYGGIIANTVNMEAQNQLWNYLLLSFIDLPSLFICWSLVESRLGRRWTNVITLLICGISLLIPAITPNNETFYTICTLTAKFGIAGTFMVIFQHASELFPTTLRNQGMGLTATIASIGGILVPQIVYIAKYGAWIPLAIIGTICLIGSICASFLPETLNEYLPQRAKEAAKFGHDRPYFCLAKIKSPNSSVNNVNEDDPETGNQQQQQQQPVNHNNNNNHQTNNNGIMKTNNRIDGDQIDEIAE